MAMAAQPRDVAEELVDLLLSTGAAARQTHLDAAIDNGLSRAIPMLVAAGCDPNAQRAGGMSLLAKCVIENGAAEAKALIAAGADINAALTMTSEMGEMGDTCLRLSAKHGRVWAANMLLDAGAVDELGERAGLPTAALAGQGLFVAAMAGRMSGGAHVIDSKGRSPLGLLAGLRARGPAGSTIQERELSGMGIAALALLGVDPSRPREDGITPLMIACKHGDLGAVQALIEANARLEDRDFSGATAMHHLCSGSAHERSSQILMRMFDAGANFFAKTAQGHIPLARVPGLQYDGATDFSKLLESLMEKLQIDHQLEPAPSAKRIKGGKAL